MIARQMPANWKVNHVTDRVVHLDKEDVAYRKYTGRDGFVRVRVQPGESRDAMFDRAENIAEMNDSILGLKLGKELLPVDFLPKERARTGKDTLVVPVGSSNVVSLEKYKQIQKILAPIFATKDQEPEQRQYRP